MRFITKKLYLLAILGFVITLILSCSNDEMSENEKKIEKQLQYFNRGDALLDLRDGRIYKTVIVGREGYVGHSISIWMADNLNYKAEGYRCYNDSLIYCEKYGALYNWEMAKSVCPKGWHLPTVAEWRDIENYFGNEVEVVRAVLQAENGFSALSGRGSSGCNNAPSNYNPINCTASGASFPCHCSGGGGYGGWWSITSDVNEEAYNFTINPYNFIWDDKSGYGIQMRDKSRFEHVRCVKDYD